MFASLWQDLRYVLRMLGKSPGHTTACVAVLALGTGLVVGIWPTWRVSGVRAMAAALHEGSARGGTRSAAQTRTRSLLVVAQVATALALLACAGLALKSFWQVENEPLGFDRHNLLTLSVSLPEVRYTHEKSTLFFSELLARMRALPGVVDAATGLNVPFDGNEWDTTFHITGTPEAALGADLTAEINYVSPGYFKTMGIALLRGRDFNADDQKGRPTKVDPMVALRED